MFIILGEVSLRAKRDAGLGEELDVDSLVLLLLTSVNIRRSPLEPELLQSDNRLTDRAELQRRFGTRAVSTEHLAVIEILPKFCYSSRPYIGVFAP